MKIHDLVRRTGDGMLGIVTRVRKNGRIHVRIMPSWEELVQSKRDWEVVSAHRKSRKSN